MSNRRRVGAILVFICSVGLGLLIGYAVDSARATTIMTDPGQPTVAPDVPWVELPDGSLDYTVQAGDVDGPWTTTRAHDAANLDMWKAVVERNKELGVTDYGFRRLIPGKSKIRIPALYAAQFKSWYLTRASGSVDTTMTATPPAPAQPQRKVSGILLGALLGLAVAGSAAVANGQRKRMLRPSNVNPMRTTPLTDPTDAVNEVREQVLALTRLQPGSPDALPNPSDWTIVSAARGLGNGAVESHFSDGTTRRELYSNEPCYEVTARNTAGEERVFHIRIRCANQLTGRTEQFLLPDFRFTPTADQVSMNVPFVAPPAAPVTTPTQTPAPEPTAPPALAAEETTLPETRSITIARCEGNTLVVTTPSGTTTVESTDPIAISADGSTVTVTIGDQVFTTEAPATPTV